MPRRANDLVGNTAQLRPDLHAQIVALVVDIQAAEHVAVLVEEERRLPIVDQQVGKEPLRIAGCRLSRLGRRSRPSAEPSRSADVTSEPPPRAAAWPRYRSASANRPYWKHT